VQNSGNDAVRHSDDEPEWQSVEEEEGGDNADDFERRSDQDDNEDENDVEEEEDEDEDGKNGNAPLLPISSTDLVSIKNNSSLL